MATVRQPGSTIDWFLPEDRDKDPEERTIFLIKVLTWDEWRAFVRKLETVSRSSTVGDVIDAARRAIGVGLVDVHNLKVLTASGDLEEFKLEKVRDELSMNSMAVLMPFKDRLIEAIQGANQFQVNDVKN